MWTWLHEMHDSLLLAAMSSLALATWRIAQRWRLIEETARLQAEATALLARERDERLRLSWRVELLWKKAGLSDERFSAVRNGSDDDEH